MSPRPVPRKRVLTEAESLQDERVQRILATVDSIPEGRVASYGQVAEEAGLPRAVAVFTQNAAA